MTENFEPALSIVLIVCDPDESSDAVLAALGRQCTNSTVEVILVDGRPAAMRPPISTDALQVRYVQLQGANMPHLKAYGAELAKGRSVAFLEPKGIPDAGWLEAALSASDRNDNVAVGGAVLFAGQNSVIDCAAFLFEYGGFSPETLRSSHAFELPGNNMIFPRRMFLDLCGSILQNHGLNKPFCQQRFFEGGGRLKMNAELTIRLSTSYDVKKFLVRRFHYARCFGGMRYKQATTKRQIMFRVGSPVVPIILLARHLFGQKKKEEPRRTISVIAMLTIICIAWSAGEVAGYWFGPGNSCKHLY